MNATDFRRVMSRFAAGVTVITARDGAGSDIGFTATAFCSLSLRPPLALVCATQGRYAHQVLAEAPAFAVNILAADQNHLAYRFADPKIENRFAGVVTRSGDFGLRLLEGSVAGVVCESHSSFAAGDHTIYVGEGCQIWDNERPPLLHYSGRFNELAPRPDRRSDAEQEIGDFLVGSPW